MMNGEDNLNFFGLLEFNTSNLVQEAFRFKQMLFDRRCPMEKNEIEKLKRSAVKEFGRAAHVNRENVEEKLIWQEEVQGEVEHRVKSQVREWSPIEYNLRHGLLYLAARFATDYSVLKQIFNEVERLVDFMNAMFFYLKFLR